MKFPIAVDPILLVIPFLFVMFCMTVQGIIITATMIMDTTTLALFQIAVAHPPDGMGGAAAALEGAAADGGNAQLGSKLATILFLAIAVPATHIVGGPRG